MEIKSLKALTKYIRYVLYIQVFIAILSITFCFLEWQLLSAYQEGIYASIEEAFSDANMTIIALQGIGVVSLLTFMVSAVLIVKWIYRANYNAHQFSVNNMTYTPVWSIAYYFIPVFNLWKPYMAMKEIWLVSERLLDRKFIKTPLILVIWWALWLSSNLLNQSIFRLSASAQQLPELMNLNMLSQVSNLLDIPLALVTLVIINSIDRMQNHRE